MQRICRPKDGGRRAVEGCGGSEGWGRGIINSGVLRYLYKTWMLMNAKVVLRVVVAALVAGAATGCVAYHPHNADIPLLHERGQLQADASLSLTAPLLAAPAVNASVAYAPLKVLGLQGAFSFTDPANLYAQAAAGAYAPWGHMVTECYLGYGHGISGYTLSNQQHHVGGRYDLFFGQVNVGWAELAGGDIDIGFGLKGGMLDGQWEKVRLDAEGAGLTEERLDGMRLLVEPQVVVRVGWKRFKLSFNVSYAHLNDWPTDNGYFNYERLSAAVGLHFRF